MADTEQSDRVSWSVGTQRHETKLDDAGRAVAGVVVPITLSSGESWEQFLPDAVYNDLARAKEAIKAAVAHHVEVARFGGVA